MWVLGPLGFTAPWLLVALAALPVLWLILRAVPPAPLRRRFPGVALLVGLRDAESETERTPWWLMALRMAALAAAILGFAGPVLHPAAREPGRGPLLVLLDASWSDAGDWGRRIERASALVAQAGREGRAVAVVRLTDAPAVPAFQAAAAVAPRVAGLAPQPWAPDPGAWVAALPEGRFASHWLSDGLDHAGRAALAAALAARGPVTVFEGPRPVLALAPPRFEEGAVRITAARLPAGPAAEAEVVARGPDPAGVERELARASLRFQPGETATEAALQLPPELRNRISRFAIEGLRSAGAVALADDSLRRRKVALVAAQGEAEALQLLSPLHYLRQALAPSADLVEGTTGDVLMAAPDVIVLADVARLAPDEAGRLEEWVEEGGLLLRFAGPRTAAAATGQEGDDPLMPVPLRAGGRSVGGAMSWGDPRTLAPFAEGSPFAGLPVPPEVAVGTQVLAQPGPDLAARTIAALADGTPLVTRRALGQGQVVLFHVTANAEWSNLPLSGLYVAMLERLAVSARAARPGEGAIEGRMWLPEVALDAFGTAAAARDRPGVEGAALAAALERGPSAAVPPGLYAAGDRRVAVNAAPAGIALAAAEWPAGVAREGLEAPAERALKGWFLVAALVALAVDVVAALALRGGLRRGLRSGGAAAALVLAGLAWPAAPARAQAAPPAAAAPDPAPAAPTPAAPDPAAPDPAADARRCRRGRGDKGAAAGACPHRRCRGGPHRRRRSARPRAAAGRAHHGRARRARRRRSRDRRAGLLPAALLAGGGGPAAALGGGLCAAEPLSPDRRHDRLRHPRR